MTLAASGFATAHVGQQLIQPGTVDNDTVPQEQQDPAKVAHDTLSGSRLILSDGAGERSTLLYLRVRGRRNTGYEGTFRQRLGRRRHLPKMVPTLPSSRVGKIRQLRASKSGEGNAQVPSTLTRHFTGLLWESGVQLVRNGG